MNLEVIGLGALNMDYIYRVERILTDGETAVTEAAKFPGGSAANTICGLARLGIKSGFIGAVGTDDDGQFLIKDFQEARVDTTGIKIKGGAKTGSVLGLSDGNQRALYVSPGANSQLDTPDIDFDYINQCQLLYTSSFVDDRQFQFLPELIQRLDASVKFGFAPGALYAARGMAALKPVLARTDILFLNQDELRQLTGQDVVPGTEECLNSGCRMVAVTLGRGTTLKLASGDKVNAAAYIRGDGAEYTVEPSLDLPVTDSTGAGDAFTAGFLYGLLKRKSLLICGRLGGITAGFCLGKSGAREGLPTLNLLSRRYQKLYGEPL